MSNPAAARYDMTQTFTLAHFSDLHLSPIVGLSPRYWTTKRALGFFNWQRHRRRVHVPAVAKALMDDALSLKIDHIAVTGDLVNLGLPREYEAALSWLQNFGAPDRITVIPGNHDVYSWIGADQGFTRWAAYMGAETDSLVFPFVRRIGPLALIGLNSAILTRPGLASGRLGAAQMEVVGDLLERLGNEGAVRVVLIHHPPLPGMTHPTRALADAHHFKRVLERSGAELVLYGHNHVTRLDWLSAQDGAIPISGAASASAALASGQDTLASYGVYTVVKSDRDVRMTRTIRGIASDGGDVVELSDEVLMPPS